MSSEAKNKLAQRQETAAAAKPGKSIAEWIVAMKPQIKKALPSVITPDRFTRMALTAVAQNPKLGDCSPASFCGAMLQAAQLGLEPNTPLGQAYLIPFRNKGKMEAQFQLGYLGLIELAHRSGEFRSIEARVVYENDEFEYEYGLEGMLHHKPALKDRGKPIAYYAVYRLVNGGYGYEVMSKEDIDEHARKYSQGIKSSFSPWVTAYDQMAMKGLDVSTKIPTPDGWTTMELLEVGDTVFDMNGDPTKVIAVSEVKNIDCYEITFSNGEKIICDEEHKWVAGIGYNASRNVKEKGWKVFPVSDLYRFKKEGKSVTIPMNPVLVLPERDDLLIDPWALGYWLGNGNKRHARVTCDVKDKQYILSKLNENYETNELKSKADNNAVEIGIRSNFVKLLREENVLMDKHIPDKYKRAGFSQRLNLLKGLIDSDGHIDNARGRAIFNSTSQRLAEDVAELASSLGECVSTSIAHAKGFGKEVLCYGVTWKPVHCPAGMPRKADRFRERIVNTYRSIRSIEKVNSVPTKCISVDSETETYLAGHSMFPTHNTVLKRVLKYAPIKTEFVKSVNTDETIKSEIEPDMVDLPSEAVEIDAEVVSDDMGTGVEGETIE